MKVAFYTPHMGLRGTEVAMFDYAKFNQTILGNESIIIYDKENDWHDAGVIQKFSQLFNCIPVDAVRNTKEVDKILTKEKTDAVYLVKGGSLSDGLLPLSSKSLIHVIGMTGPEHSHGDIWAYASYFLKNSCGKGSDVPVVPYMTYLPEVNEDLRSDLGIPKDSLVFGRTGGMDTWNLSYANQVVYEALNRRNDVYFIFQNTSIPFRHERLIFLPTSSDLVYKTKFINTCDAMIHARHEGESFGIACAEFSLRNKPVITWSGSSERSHLEILGEKAHTYYTPQDMLDAIINFQRKFDDYNCYREYSPESVMPIFKKVFLDG
jgi:hypothetical protein